MYLEHFGLQESPFRITPHTEFFFSGANRGATLEALLYAATHDEGIIKITGEVGSGKTMLCRVLMERLPEHVVIAYLSNPSLSREDIHHAIADELALSLPENSRPSATLKVLQNHLIHLYGEGKRVVVLIDEAHAMPMETLEEIRLLSNLESNRNKLLQLILFGQPELNQILARADMRQLKERITHNFSLEPLVRTDVAEYLDFRMRAAGYKGPNVFNPAANKLIFDASLGLTRRINILADKSLLAAFAAGSHQITPTEVRAAIRDCDFSNATIAGQAKGKRRVAITIALSLGLAATIAAIAVSGIGQGSSRHLLPKATPAIAAPVIANPVVAAPVAPIASVVAATASPKTSTSLVEQTLERSKLWLTAVSDDHWFLQLYAVDADHQALMESYLQRLGTNAQTAQQLHLYRSDLSGKMRFGLIYGDFPNRADALTAITQLPAWVQATQPYARQVKKLR